MRGRGRGRANLNVSDLIWNIQTNATTDDFIDVLDMLHLIGLVTVIDMVDACFIWLVGLDSTHCYNTHYTHFLHNYYNFVENVSIIIQWFTVLSCDENQSGIEWQSKISSKIQSVKTKIFTWFCRCFGWSNLWLFTITMGKWKSIALSFWFLSK